MAESDDYSPAPHWSGHDFASARNTYASHVRNSYADATVKGVIAADLVPSKLVSKAEASLVIACDVTGSMGTWPQTIFSKLPYLEYETKEYLGEGVEISFAAIGDATTDKYPLQVQEFATGAELKNSLTKLVVEGGGGCNVVESYDLLALYYGRNVEFPNAVRKPILIIIGDEGIVAATNGTHAKKFAKVDITGNLDTDKVFEELKDKYNVYVVRKPYSGDFNNPTMDERRIQAQWSKMLGADHVVNLPEAERVVDVIFGILAEETGRQDYFEKELKDRQLKDKGGSKKVDVVMKSLVTVHAPKSARKLPAPGKSNSVSRSKPGAAKSISLLD